MTPRYPVTPMKTAKPVFLSVLALVAIVAAVLPLNDPADKRILQLTGMLEGLKQYHYQPKEINDEFSTQVYNTFLENLDGNKRFFTAADIDKLSSHERQIDDQINAKTFTFFNDATAKYEKGIEKTAAWYAEILSEPMDFNAEERIETDADKLDWAKDDQELRERWRKVLKYEILYRIHDELDEEGNLKEKEIKAEDEKVKSFEEIEKEAREAVLERYNEWFDRLKKTKSSEFFSEYLSTIAGIFDPHTQYFEPVEKANFDISMSGKLEGIGARLQTEKDDTKVMSIVPGGPAWKQKELEVNDVIIKVAQGSEEAVVVTGMNINDVVSLIRGKKGTEVVLTVRKVDGTIKQITILRDEVLLDESFAKSVILSEQGKNERIGYIRLPRFYADFESSDGRSCSVDMAKEIEKLKNENVSGIIVDLRNNGGGSLRDVVTMTGFFIEKGPIVQVKSKSGRPSLHEDRDPTVQWDGPLIIMVNEFSASASEIMAAALQDYDRAVIVGSPSTYGKGTVQRFLDLDNTIVGNNTNKPLGEIKLTIQNFYRINGGSTQLKGVIPDIILPDNYNLLDIGEKEYDFALPFSEIQAVPFDQKVYRTDRYLSELLTKSEARVNQAEHFKKTKENAVRFKRQRDETAYSLKLDAYKAFVEQRQKESERFKELYPGNEKLVVLNPATDMVYIQADSSRIARNDDFVKNVKNDMHLTETMDIMRDILRIDREYARSKK
jgi:carboxyl-terminal processing protease